jgi:transcriptional regulator with XRE-family HTH domain
MSNVRTMQDLTGNLTPQQLQAAELIVENEFNRALGITPKTLEEIGDEIGMSRQSISKWKKMPAFIEYSAYISKQHTDSLRPLADSQLAKLMKGTSNNGIPSIKALELYYKISGVLVERREQTYVDGNQPKLTQAQINSGIDDLAAKLLKQ